MSDLLAVEELSKLYGRQGAGVQALEAVSFSVPEGSFFTLLGPSGCGKTTLLRCVAGLEEPSAGEIRIGGDPIYSRAARLNLPPEERPVGMVFQSYAIWPHMTVFDNVAFPLKHGRRRMTGSEVRRRVDAMLERVGLTMARSRWATQLSGGQQQRLALARALAGEPRLLLLDEPLSNLDVNLRVSLRSELKRFQRMLGVTTLYVTHDQSEALALSDRIAVLKDGAIEQVGRPQELYEHPETSFVAGAVGGTNLVKGRFGGQGGTGFVDGPFGRLTLCSPDGVDHGDEVVVCVRPEQVELSPGRPDMDHASNLFEGRVVQVEYLGDRSDCFVQLAETVVRGRAPSSASLREGDAVWVRLPPEHCRLVRQ